MSITVKTKSELESAIESGGQEIIVVGELAEKTYDARNIKKLGSVSMAILGGGSHRSNSFYQWAFSSPCFCCCISHRRSVNGLHSCHYLFGYSACFEDGRKL